MISMKRNEKEDAGERGERKNFEERGRVCRRKQEKRFRKKGREEEIDGYYVAYKPITLSRILFMFIEMKFIHCHSCVMFAMKSMSMCND